MTPGLTASYGEAVVSTVAFQGEQGAYSEEAIFQYFGIDVQTHACRGFADVFDEVESGESDYGMLPVENSTAGSINQAYDLLLDHDARIWGEVILRVRHALLSLPDTSVDDIQTVRSHPQALAQCERYLSSRGWIAETAYDTAGSASDLASTGESGVAVIASRLAGQLYGLHELDYGIEDSFHNYTRFFILSEQEPEGAERCKTSVIISTRHVPGALHACLGEFASRGINLTKIESRPRRDRPWHYVFYLDFEGHWQDPECAQALNGLLLSASFVKVLGSYPAASIPETSP